MKVPVVNYRCGHREPLTAASDDTLRVVAAGAIVQANVSAETTAITSAIAAALLRDRAQGAAS